MRSFARASLRGAAATMMPCSSMAHHLQQHRSMATADLITQLQGFQKEFNASRSREVSDKACNLLQQEVLDDHQELAVQNVEAIFAASAVFRPQLGKHLCDPLVASTNWILEPERTATLDARTIATSVNALVLLNAPLAFEVLVVCIPRVMELADSMDLPTLAMIVNSYGRSGTRHGMLYAKLSECVIKAIGDCKSIAHVANMSFAFAKAGVRDEQLFNKLAGVALDLQNQCVPLVAATMLEAFGTIGLQHEDLFVAMERHAHERLAECSAPLMASLLTAVAKLKRNDSVLFTAIADRSLQQMDSLDAHCISKIMTAYEIANLNNEELFGALAERACAITSYFRIDEAALVLKGLSHFELYDGELFPKLASRVMFCMRKRMPYDVNDLVSILASFAAVHERNDELIMSAMKDIKFRMPNLTPAGLIDLMWSFSQMGMQHEMLEEVKKQFDMVAHESDKEGKRWEKVKDTFYSGNGGGMMMNNADKPMMETQDGGGEAAVAF